MIETDAHVAAAIADRQAARAARAAPWLAYVHPVTSPGAGPGDTHELRLRVLVDLTLYGDDPQDLATCAAECRTVRGLAALAEHHEGAIDDVLPRPEESP